MSPHSFHPLRGLLGLSESSVVPLSLALLCCAIASACATSSSAGPTETALRAQIKAMEQTHFEDQRKIEALQTEVENLGEAKASQGPPEGSELPTDLRVIHLQQPSKGQPPPLATAVPLHEPTTDEIALISAARPTELTEPTRGGGAGSPEEADSLFSDAFEKLKTGELVRAANEFQEFARRYPHHPAADNALLDEGIAYYGLRRYADASTAFRTLIKRYPAGDAVPEAMFREAECAERLGHRDQARSLLSHLKDSYPQSAEAARAGRRLEELAANEGEVR
jgi:tol-pal system protein YbgF